jgi:hypothetical protein
VAAAGAKVQEKPWTDTPLSLDHLAADHQHLFTISVVLIDMRPLRTRRHIDHPDAQSARIGKVAAEASWSNDDGFDLVGIGDGEHGKVPR